MRPILCLAACLMLTLGPQVTQAQDPEDDEPVQGRDVGADALLMQPGDVGRPISMEPLDEHSIDPGDDGKGGPAIGTKAIDPGDDGRMRPGADFRQPAMQPAAPATRMAPAQQAPMQPASPGSLRGFNPQPEPPAVGR
ncbi:hypothetical protein [Thioalbus denitrificans]|nr:hypothetical protein [Thioalbus denitrificans]